MSLPSPPILVLGSMPQDAEPARNLAAGAWCFAGREDFFPDWEDRFRFAPEPQLDLEARGRLAKIAQALCVDSIPRLAGHLCPSGGEAPAAYWETLLAPWAVDVARQLVDRWERVKAMTAAWGDMELTVPLLPAECSFAFPTEHAFTLHGALGAAFNHWLISRLLEARWPAAWKKELLAPVHEAPEEPAPATLLERIANRLRNMQLRLPFPRLKGMTVGQALRLSRALLHASRGEDRSLSLAATYSGAVSGARHDIPLDTLPLFLACLPQSLRQMKHPRRFRKSRRPRLRVASVAAYENAPYRQQLALWRARGNRLMYVQHGGNYGQTRFTCDCALVEYSQHAFATWGWERHGDARGNFIPLPHPQLARIADSWRGQESDRLLVVGTEMPLYGYRLDAHPSPMQMLQYREDKQWFFEALGRALQSRAFYRPYFDVPGTLADATWLLPRFPDVRLCSGPLTPQMLTCRLLVIDHHGTTMLEALAANVPTVLFWNRDVWPLTPESEALLEKLAKAGIWFGAAEDAAVKVREIWDDPVAWWHGDAVQEARRAYCARQAMPAEGDVTSCWIKKLATL